MWWQLPRFWLLLKGWNVRIFYTHCDIKFIQILCCVKYFHYCVWAGSECMYIWFKYCASIFIFGLDFEELKMQAVNFLIFYPYIHNNFTGSSTNWCYLCSHIFIYYLWLDFITFKCSKWYQNQSSSTENCFVNDETIHKKISNSIWLKKNYTVQQTILTKHTMTVTSWCF